MQAALGVMFSGMACMLLGYLNHRVRVEGVRGNEPDLHGGLILLLHASESFKDRGVNFPHKVL